VEKGLRLPLRTDFAQLGKRFIAHASWTKIPPRPIRLHYSFLAIFFSLSLHMHPDFSKTLMVYIRQDTGSILLMPRRRSEISHDKSHRVSSRLIDMLIDRNYVCDNACVNYQFLRCANYIIIQKLIINIA